MGPRSLSLLLHTLWLAAFICEAAILGTLARRFDRALERIQGADLALEDRGRELAQLVRQTRKLGEERLYLDSLTDILPKNQGFIRTQKAVADEVGALRREVARRLGGSLHVVVDTRTNKLFLKKGAELLWEADCSVGRGGTLTDRRTGRRWEFVTPRGEFRVLGKLENPAWIKPDWAFTESNEPIPPPEDPSRKVEGELGAYVLNLGDGYLIHGTKNEAALGTPASHGCVRLGAEPLKKLYEAVPPGTRVFIY